MKPEHPIHSKYSYPLANGSAAKHSRSVTDSALLSSIDLLTNTAQSLPQQAISEKDIMSEGASPTSLPQQKINEICKIALDEITDCFNRQRLLIRTVYPGRVDVENGNFSGSHIESYYQSAYENGYSNDQYNSASLILPNASVTPYCGVSEMGIIITDPKHIFAASDHDINSWMDESGTMHCPKESIGKSIEDVAEKYNNREISLTVHNEIIVSKIALEELGGIFVPQYNNRPLNGLQISLAVMNQQQILKSTGCYAPIFIYHRLCPHSNLDNMHSEVRLLKKSEAINYLSLCDNKKIDKNSINNIIEKLDLPT